MNIQDIRNNEYPNIILLKKVERRLSCRAGMIRREWRLALLAACQTQTIHTCSYMQTLLHGIKTISRVGRWTGDVWMYKDVVIDGRLRADVTLPAPPKKKCWGSRRAGHACEGVHPLLEKRSMAPDPKYISSDASTGSQRIECEPSFNFT